jgi:hypothetical protein
MKTEIRRALHELTQTGTPLPLDVRIANACHILEDALATPSETQQELKTLLSWLTRLDEHGTASIPADEIPSIRRLLETFVEKP